MRSTDTETLTDVARDPRERRGVLLREQLRHPGGLTARAAERRLHDVEELEKQILKQHAREAEAQAAGVAQVGLGGTR